MIFFSWIFAVPLAYFAVLVDAWRRCAYAKRLPSKDEVEQLTKKYSETFA